MVPGLFKREASETRLQSTTDIKKPGGPSEQQQCFESSDLEFICWDNCPRAQKRRLPTEPLDEKIAAYDQ